MSFSQALGLCLSVGGIAFALMLRSDKKKGYRDLLRMELMWPLILLVSSGCLVWELWALAR